MKHYIIVKWNETVKDKQALIPGINELFQHTTAIPGISKVELFPNVVNRPNRYDLMIAITMAPEALELYDACEWHKTWKKNYGDLIEKKTIFDQE